MINLGNVQKLLSIVKSVVDMVNSAYYFIKSRLINYESITITLFLV